MVQTPFMKDLDKLEVMGKAEMFFLILFLINCKGIY